MKGKYQPSPKISGVFPSFLKYFIFGNSDFDNAYPFIVKI